MRAAIPTAEAGYPTKPVRMIEPFGAGSGPEVVATVVGRKLAELWGQPVTVENHPGAGSTAAPALVAASPAERRPAGSPYASTSAPRNDGSASEDLVNERTDVRELRRRNTFRGFSS